MKLGNFMAVYEMGLELQPMRRHYAKLQGLVPVFAAVPTLPRLSALEENYHMPLMLLCNASNQLGIVAVHHPDPDEEGKPYVDKAKEVFFMAGDHAVVKAPVTAFDLITDKDKPVYAPAFADLFSVDNVENPNIETLLALPVDKTKPLSFPAAMHIPPLAYSSIATKEPTDVAGMLVSLLSVYSTWYDQCIAKLPCDNVDNAIYQTASILWLMAHTQANLPDKDFVVPVFVDQVLPLPLPLAPDAIPLSTMEHYTGIKEYFIAKDAPRRQEQQDDQPPERLADSTRASTPTSELSTLLATILSNQDRRDALANNTFNRLIEHQLSSPTGSSTTGFSKLQPKTQRMVLRLAMDDRRNMPTVPSQAQTAFFAASVSNAMSQLQSGFSNIQSNFIVHRGFSMLVHSGNWPAIDRANDVNLSLLQFTRPYEAASTAAQLAEDMALASPTCSDATIKKATVIKNHFVTCHLQLVQAIESYAGFFDVIAGYDETSAAPRNSFVGNVLRTVAHQLKNQYNHLRANQQADVDFTAQLANYIDFMVDEYMRQCRELPDFSTEVLEILHKETRQLRLNSNKLDVTVPVALRPLLPSALANPANAKKRGNPADHDDEDVGDGSEKKQKQKKQPAAALGRKNAHHDRSLVVEGVFSNVFTREAMTNCPTVSKGNKTLQLCLKFYCLGVCKYGPCDRCHDRLNAAKLAELKNFVASCVAAHAAAT